MGALTILCGTNSAGKSTIIKALLLLRQTILSRDSSLTKDNQSRLRLSGNMLDLGTFKSFITHNQTDRDLKLGITITDYIPSDGLFSSQNQISLLEDASASSDDSGTEYKLSVDFYFGLYTQTDSLLPAPLTSDQQSDLSSAGNAVLKRACFSIFHREKVVLEYEVRAQVETAGTQSGYLLLLPKTYVEQTPELEALSYGDGGSGYVSFVTTLRGVLPERLHAKARADETLPPRYWPLPSQLEVILQDLRYNLHRLTYLGPLRAAARRYYTGHTDANTDADVTGESLPYVLTEKLYERVVNAEPGTHKPSRTTLAVALNSWLYFLRTGLTSESLEQCGDELKVSSPHDVIVSLGVKSPDGLETHALADSGFGYSQVLPILVKGLMLQSGACLLIEQPEVHLNPALQVRIAEFLAAMSDVGKQIVIETHSEHIVNAIRAISAETYLQSAYETDLSEYSPKNPYAILFLENVRGVTHLHKMTIRKDGTVPDWPSSFFGESAQLLGRVMRAQSKVKGRS
jgi:predicted ATPase